MHEWITQFPKLIFTGLEGVAIAVSASRGYMPLYTDDDNEWQEGSRHWFDTEEEARAFIAQWV